MAVARRGRAGIVTPGSVPTLQVEVDWSHPLANGLIACYVPGGARGLVDLSGNGPLLTIGSGARLGATSSGSGLINTSASAGASSPVIPDAWKIASSGSLFISADWYGSPGVSNAILWGLIYDLSGGTPFNDYSLGVVFSTGRASFNYNAGGVVGTTNSTVSAPTSGRHSLAATFSVGGVVSIYQDAVSVGSGIWTGGSPTYTSPLASLGYNPAQPARITNTGIAVALTYNRPLTPGEIAVLDRDPFCMLRPARRLAFKASSSTLLVLTSRGSAFSRGRGTLSLSQPLTSVGSVRSQGQSVLSLPQALTSRGAAFSRGKVALSLVRPLTAMGSAFSQGRGALSLSHPLISVGSVRSQGQAVLLLSQALTSRGVTFSRGRGGALTILLPLALTSLGSARSTGKSSPFILSLALVSQGSSFSRGRGVLTVDGTPLAFVSRGSAFSHGRDVLALPIIVPLHSRGQAFAHGGMVRGGRQGAGVLTLTPFVPSQNIINIGMPQRGLPIADPKTGQMNQNWYLFFHALWQRGGGPIGN